MPAFKHAKKGLAHPLEVKLGPGRYKWCGCGRTGQVPWCDGTCKGGKPVRFEVKKRTALEICTCGLTKTPPYCDHSQKVCAAKAGGKSAAKGARKGGKAKPKKAGRGKTKT